MGEGPGGGSEMRAVRTAALCLRWLPLATATPKGRAARLTSLRYLRLGHGSPWLRATFPGACMKAAGGGQALGTTGLPQQLSPGSSSSQDIVAVLRWPDSPHPLDRAAEGRGGEGVL